MKKSPSSAGRRSARIPAALAHIQPVLAASTVGLPPPEPQRLIDYVGMFAWHETVFRLAILSSIMANRGPDDAAVRQLTVDIFLRSDPDKMTPRGRALWEHMIRLERPPPIANEASILFAQALAIMYGKPDGPAPSDGHLAEILVASNDYAFEWGEADTRVLTRRERSVADTTRALGFNRGVDPAREAVRSYQMLRCRPARHALWKSDQDWKELQQRGFGMPLDVYLEAFVLPIVQMSMMWGSRHPLGFEPPVIDPSTWWQETLVDQQDAEQLLRGLTWTREDAAVELRRLARTDGLVVGPTCFYRKPFVELPNRRALALSPWMVREQLRGGLWGKHREATEPSGEWPAAFGDLFEEWCQRVASMAKPDAVDHIIVPTARGTDDGEIEDIVIRKNDKVVFVSIKASTIPEATMRGARSRQRVLEWFDRFLFADKGQTDHGQKHGGGAVRRLDAKISKLRSGMYEGQGLARTLKVFPLVIAYEHGFDSPAIYAWTEDRCRALGLLRQPRVEPLTFGAVEDLEALFALSTRGHSAIDILRQKVGVDWRRGRFDMLLYERAKDPLELRLPQLTREFEEIAERQTKRMFGRAPTWGRVLRAATDRR